MLIIYFYETKVLIDNLNRFKGFVQILHFEVKTKTSQKKTGFQKLICFPYFCRQMLMISQECV